MEDRDQLLCLCKKVSLGTIQDLIDAQPGITLEQIKETTKAGTGCGKCVDASGGRTLHLQGQLDAKK